MLYELAENCEVGNKRDEDIRGRLVMDIRDKELSQKFQLTAYLTLAQVIQQVCQQEEVAKQMSLQTDPSELQVANVSTDKWGSVGTSVSHNNTERSHRVYGTVSVSG